MAPKRPKPPDVRHKEQQIREREKEARRREYKRLKLRCPNCDETSMAFHRSDTLSKMIVYCARCFCGDCIDWKGRDKDFYHKFKDNFVTAWKAQTEAPRQGAVRYFNGKTYRGTLNDFKKQIVKALEEMTMKTRAPRKDKDDFFLPIATRFAEETGNPYGFIQVLDNPEILVQRAKKALEKVEGELRRQRQRRLHSLRGEELLREIERINASLKSTWMSQKHAIVRIERGGPFCKDDCICLKCINYGKSENCTCPCSYSNITKTTFCVDFSPA